MQIKAQLGKLELERPLQQIVREQQEDNRLEILSVEPMFDHYPIQVFAVCPIDSRLCLHLSRR